MKKNKISNIDNIRFIQEDAKYYYNCYKNDDKFVKLIGHIKIMIRILLKLLKLLMVILIIIRNYLKINILYLLLPLLDAQIILKIYIYYLNNLNLKKIHITKKK